MNFEDLGEDEELGTPVMEVLRTSEFFERRDLDR